MVYASVPTPPLAIAAGAKLLLTDGAGVDRHRVGQRGGSRDDQVDVVGFRDRHVGASA